MKGDKKNALLYQTILDDFEKQERIWNEEVEDNVTRVYRTRWDERIGQLAAA